MNFINQLQLLTEKGYAAALAHKEVNAQKVFTQQLALLNKLQKYILQNPAKSHPQHTKLKNMTDVLTIAYYLSEYGHESLFPHILLSQQTVLKTAAEILGINVNTLRNKRNYFDSHTNSTRKGWQVPLTKEQLEIFNTMKILSKEQAQKKARGILSRQTDENLQAEQLP